jgi:hypothetical protein
LTYVSRKPNYVFIQKKQSYKNEEISEKKEQKFDKNNTFLDVYMDHKHYPSWEEMISKALLYKETQYMSKVSISKYICSNYNTEGDLVGTNVIKTVIK